MTVTTLALSPDNNVADNNNVTVLLGGYPAKQCPTRTHNDFSPVVPDPEEDSADVAQRKADGIDFEVVIVDLMVKALGERCVNIEYGDHRGDKARRITETVTAMEAGAQVILGGQLPDDYTGSRTGSPDVLFRVTPDGADPKYVPGDIKHHGTMKSAKTTKVTVSGLSQTFVDRTEQAGYTTSTGHRVGDAMQLAHYTRMLEAIGRHPGPNMYVGAILGSTDFTDLTGDEYGFVWYDLSALTEKTWSGTAETGWVKRSIMDVYDYEFALRVKVAQAARDEVAPVVVGIGKSECGQCPYKKWCAEQANTRVGGQDASFTISLGQLTDREWRYLHAQGYTTIDEVASLDLTDVNLLAGYKKAASNLSKPEQRLADVVRRAKMHRDDIALERTGTGVLTVPVADVEIDFDVEWHPADGHVYQWGARVRYNSDDTTSTYSHTVISFDPLDEDSATALAEDFFGWMEKFVADHEANGQSVAIYHWTTPETTRATRMLGGERAKALFDGRFMDLKDFMAKRFFARDGFSLKNVAPIFGFNWNVDDASGLTSVTKIDDARHSADPATVAAAKAWLLSYNEDDCAAQAAIRDGLHAHVTSPSIPG